VAGANIRKYLERIRVEIKSALTVAQQNSNGGST